MGVARNSANRNGGAPTRAPVAEAEAEMHHHDPDGRVEPPAIRASWLA